MSRVITLTPEAIAQNVYSAIGECATHLRGDYLNAIECSLEKAQNVSSASNSVLASILENAKIAEEDGVPVCQDTGSVWVCLEIGPDVSLAGDIFSKVDEAVGRAYADFRLRMSIVEDALFDRSNTENNTPSFCELKVRKDSGATLHVLLKGGGSDNASRLLMLAPSEGKEGIKRAVVECVKEKAANACPPLVIGLGVGATFDKVASLSKCALLREIGSPAESDEAEAFEEEVLEAVNGLKIGPGALGGIPTAIAVHLKTAPCHIAALPVAINMGCCALRSKTIELG